MPATWSISGSNRNGAMGFATSGQHRHEMSDRAKYQRQNSAGKHKVHRRQKGQLAVKLQCSTGEEEHESGASQIDQHALSRCLKPEQSVWRNR